MELVCPSLDRSKDGCCGARNPVFTKNQTTAIRFLFFYCLLFIYLFSYHFFLSFFFFFFEIIIIVYYIIMIIIYLFINLFVYLFIFTNIRLLTRNGFIFKLYGNAIV